MKENEPPGQSPEELLRYLDVQLAMQRARKKPPERNRAIFLVASVLFIIASAAAALLALEEMIPEAPRNGHRDPQAHATPGANF